MTVAELIKLLDLNRDKTRLVTIKIQGEAVPLAQAMHPITVKRGDESYDCIVLEPDTWPDERRGE